MGEMTTSSVSPQWMDVRPSRAACLADARLQLHYAAQFAAAVGISYLAPKPDDSHTNLGWDPKHSALRSREARALSHGVRVAVRAHDLTLLVLVNGSVGQRIPLHGSTIPQVEVTLRSALAATGLDGRRLTLRRHYQLPSHPVAGGRPFDMNQPDDFGDLATWYGNASTVLGDIRRRLESSEVRCWPHHFDLATLCTVAPDRTVGVGFSPGDSLYAEPYFYVNMNRAPSGDLPNLALGSWHTDRWFGAVLRGSELPEGGAAQTDRVNSFLDGAVAACTEMSKT